MDYESFIKGLRVGLVLGRDIPPEPPAPADCLTFSSASDFTLNAERGKSWNGQIEYMTPNVEWQVWDGTTISSVSGKLYLRGTGNNAIGSAYHNSTTWILTGENIHCTGNIETILDYTMVAAHQHPQMSWYCFETLFQGQTALVEAPTLPAVTLTSHCYSFMFAYTSITSAPELPATTLAESCYSAMFYNCKYLTMTQPTLPATTLQYGCYSNMFAGCIALETPPELPATTMATLCYYNMFSECRSLTTPPELKAMTLADGCYIGMFTLCTHMTRVPNLPATAHPYSNIYRSMFYDCVALIVNTRQTEDCPYPWRIPTSGTISDQSLIGQDALYLVPGSRGIGSSGDSLHPNTTYYVNNPPV